MIRQIMITRLLILLIIAGSVAAQTPVGTLIGRVVDSETGEPIIGANVVIAHTTRGAATDLEGRFTVPSLPTGEYELIVSSVGYAVKRIGGVRVVAETSRAISIALTPEAIVSDEVVVEAQARAAYEGALLALQRKASTIGDGVSAEQIKRTGDATSSEMVRRIPGIAIVDNRFIFVRGTSERYSRAVLNGAQLPGAEPERRSFAFDLLPTNLIEHTTITKSFTPELPGDVSGGYVQVTTVDFPNDLTGSAQLSSSVVGKTTFRPFYSYRGGSLDHLGIDDGVRSLPAGFPKDLKDPALSPEVLRNAARSLNNTWSPERKRAPLNRGFSVSLGDGARLFGSSVGFVTALTYQTGFEYAQIVRNEYEASDEMRFSYLGNRSTQRTRWGGIFNLSYKLSPTTKLSLKNTYSLNAEDHVTLLQGKQFTDAGAEQEMTALQFVSRSVYAGQLMGEHSLRAPGGVRLQWRAFYSRASRSEPDYRRLTYARPIGSTEAMSAVLGFQANLKNGGRFFSDLVDQTGGGALDGSFPFAGGNIKAGLYVETMRRDFSSRLIGIVVNARGNGYTDEFLYRLPADRIFAPENFRPNGFSIDEYANGTNNYDANQFTGATFVMLDIPVADALRFVGGVRVERVVQSVNSFDVSGRKPIAIVTGSLDILPSVNVVYGLDSRTNIRAAYARTVNRPELRELAPFTYFDFSTQTSIRGNAQLRPSTIHNLDVRFERYPSPGELLSASLFVKQMNNAIEKVVVSGSALGSERTFANAAHAINYGFEVESRLSLGHVYTHLSDLSLRLNYAQVRSVVDVSGTETTQGRSGRPLQGQSPYTLNVGLSYINAEAKTSVEVLYYVFGRRIMEAATAYQEDLIEEARGSLDFVVSSRVTDEIQVKLSWRDVLAQDQVLTQGGRLARRDSRNPTITLGFGYEF